MVSKKVFEDFNDVGGEPKNAVTATARALVVVADRLERIAEAISRHAEAVTKHDFKMLSDSIDDAIKAQRNEDKGTNS